MHDRGSCEGQITDRDVKWKSYQRPKSISEVLDLLNQAEGRGRVIAGGTDLIIQLRQHEYAADILADITKIEELKHIRENEDWIHIGAAVTHAEVAQSDVIRKEAKALAEGCASVGSPQIRNMATLMGNVISAQPAADGAICLTALEAEIKVASTSEERWISLEETCRGIGLSCVDATCEVATEIRFKKPGEWGRTKFFRLSRRKALALPILNGAVAIRLNHSLNRIQKARVAIGPVSERPFRPRKAEVYLESKEISPDLVDESARIASEEANPRTSLLRGSDVYRKEMIRLYLARTIRELLEELE